MFEGFSEATIDFLYGISFNNERMWFNAHKEDYVNHLYQPMKVLAGEVFDAVLDRCPDRDLLCKVSRIYRDARRCHGMSPYRDHLWFSFLPPVENWQAAPGFWFELRRNSWSYGMGLWPDRAATMARHRALIDAHPQRLSDLYGRLLDQSEFLLEGERYARFKPCATAPLAGWYNMKRFNLCHDSDDLSETFDGPALVRRLTDGFVFLMDYYDYFYPLCEAAQGPDPS